MEGPDLIAEHLMLVVLCKPQEDLVAGLTHPDGSTTSSGALTRVVVSAGSPASAEQGGSISAAPTTPDRGAGEHRAVATPSPQQSKVSCPIDCASRQFRTSCSGDRAPQHAA